MITLPHTGIRVTSLRQTDVESGIAWSAVLRKGRVKLGTIANHGTGGMTLFYAETSGTRRTLAEFVDQCRDNTGEPVDKETVIDDLTTEYEWARCGQGPEEAPLHGPFLRRHRHPRKRHVHPAGPIPRL